MRREATGGVRRRRGRGPAVLQRVVRHVVQAGRWRGSGAAAGRDEHDDEGDEARHERQRVVAAGRRWRRAAGRSTKTVASSAAGWGRGGAADAGFNLRSYSASYAASYSPFEDPSPAEKTGGGGGGAATWASSAGRRSVNLRGYTPSFAALDDTAVAPPIPAKKQVSPTGSFAGAVVDDAELQRRKRLVAYKAYDVEGKVKDSVRRSVKWIKGKCSRAVDGKW